MEVDWVTTIAQIINFLILVALLRHFLYGPITRAMENRRQAIKSEIEEAKERESEARRKEQEYEQKRSELDEQTEDLLETARNEAQERRDEMIGSARQEVDELQRRWQEHLREEREAFLRELRSRMGAGACSVAREALEDLANAQLQEQIISVFLDRMRELDPERAGRLREAHSEAGSPPLLVSAFELAQDQRESLQQGVHELLETDEEMEFRTSGDLLCGAELNLGGRKLAWSIDSYLDSLVDDVSEALRSEAEEEKEKEGENDRTEPA